ncbi:MAG: hypothetical protein ACI90V_005780, partial [Bacillariaceae sp.]
QETVTYYLTITSQPDVPKRDDEMMKEV